MRKMPADLSGGMVGMVALAHYPHHGPAALAAGRHLAAGWTPTDRMPSATWCVHCTASWD